MPSYTNTVTPTHQDFTWTGTTGSFASIALIPGIEYNAQLEVERQFALDRSGNPTIAAFLGNEFVSTQDKRQVFVIPNQYITYNTTNKTITGFTLSSYNYTYYLTTDLTQTTPLTILVPDISTSLNTLFTVKRKSISNQALVTWADGGKLTSSQLNLQTQQLLFLAQETADRINTELSNATDIAYAIADGAITYTKILGDGVNAWNFASPLLTISPTADLHATTRLYTLNSIYNHGVITKDDTAPSSSAVDILETAATAGNSGIWFDPKLGQLQVWAGNAWVALVGVPLSTNNIVDIGSTQTITGAKTFSSATTLSSTLGVTGATTLSSTLGVTGATTLSSTLGVTGATTLSSTLGVTGATTLSSTLGVTGATTLSSTLGVTGNLSVNTNKFTVAASSGDTLAAGTFTATGGVSAASLTSKIQPITASVAASALTITLNPTILDFRSSTLTSGAVTTVVVPTAISLTIPSGATLGTVNNVQSRIVVVAINYNGAVELAAVNMSGGQVRDETTPLSTTAVVSGSNLDTTYYSTTARSSVAYRVVGYVESTQATAGTWATAPSTIQGMGGQALTAMSSIGYGQTWKVFNNTDRGIGTTYYNTTGKPIQVVPAFQGSATGNVLFLTINGVVVRGSMIAGVSFESILYAIVPPNSSYVLTISAGASTFVAWTELR